MGDDTLHPDTAIDYEKLQKELEHSECCLRHIAKECWENAEEKGFHEVNDNPITWVANFHGEVSEFFEAYREGRLHKECDKGIGITCAEEELADIIIRTCDVACQLKIDIVRVVRAKMTYNRTRPFQHGGKKA